MFKNHVIPDVLSKSNLLEMLWKAAILETLNNNIKLSKGNTKLLKNT